MPRTGAAVRVCDLQQYRPQAALAIFVLRVLAVLCLANAGRWRMLYSTVPGPSSGRLGPFVGDVFQDICPDEKRSELLVLRWWSSVQQAVMS